MLREKNVSIGDAWYVILKPKLEHSLRVYLTIILNASYNGRNFDIILKIVCWCVPCFPQKCSSLLFFPETAADCLRLLCVCVLCVWYQVHRWKVWLVMCAQCKLSLSLSVCVHTANFSHTQAHAHSQFSLRYANHFDGTFVFFVNSNFFSPIRTVSAEAQQRVSRCRQLLNNFFFTSFSRLYVQWYFREIYAIWSLSKYIHLFMHTQNTHAEIFNSHGTAE